jgi:hypothetical protein
MQEWIAPTHTEQGRLLLLGEAEKFAKEKASLKEQGIK